eukprot:Platyproteum_vivax@DN12847_c0_g1_i1.p2
MSLITFGLTCAGYSTGLNVLANQAIKEGQPINKTIRLGDAKKPQKYNIPKAFLHLYEGPGFVIPLCQNEANRGTDVCIIHKLFLTSKSNTLPMYSALIP